MSIISNKIPAFVLSGALLLFCTCTSHTSSRQEKPVVTVSIEPMRSLVQAIADTLFDVKCMVPESNNPETYEPVPSQIADLSQSKAFLRIGPIGFEQAWIGRLQAIAPNMKVMDMTEGINYLHGHTHHAEHTHADGADPHIWTSLHNIRQIAANIRDALTILSPTDSLFFRERYKTLENLTQDTDRRIRQILSQGADSTFLIYHPTLSYFSHDYGLHQLCIEEDGKEPSPARLRSLIDECHRLRARVIFVQQQFDTRHAEVIAEQTGCRLVNINPLSPDWMNEIIRIANELAHNGNNP